MDTPAVFQFLAEQARSGKRTALVTVCAVEGSSMRNPGTHMGVSEDGSFAGSLSGGCIENAVVAEARSAITRGEPRMVRFGAGSPYFDIKLPCGGGLDLHFQPLSNDSLVRSACEAAMRREPFSIEITARGAQFAKGPAKGPANGFAAPAFNHTKGTDTGTGTFGHWPALRLLIVGHGAGVEALAALSRSMQCDVEVLTPDDRIERALNRQSIAARPLTRTTDTHLLTSDPWTAITFLFHDHDWEIDLMKAALALPHFYIGAMGGRKAHEFRQSALIQAGVDQSQIDTIHAPLGLFHSSRDPQTLALSALSEIMLAYQRADFGRDHG